MSGNLGDLPLHNDRAAGIAAILENSSIEGCSFTGTAGSYGSDRGSTFSGGIVAQMYSGTIKNCTVKNATIKANPGYLDISTGYAGGIVAHMSGGTVENCTVDENTIISGVSERQWLYPNLQWGQISAGGIVGFLNKADGILNRGSVKNNVCYAQIEAKNDEDAPLRGSLRVGGIIGEIGNSNISVEGNSYNGDLSGSPANAMYKGGIIGKITGENVPSISDNMYVGAAFGIGYDAGGDASDNPGCLNLANLTIEITKESLPSGTIDKSYRTTLSAKVTGGDFPVTWSKTSGTLPPGLTLSTSGVISGIPIEADTYTFTVTAKLGENGIKTASKEYTITITDGNQPTYSLTVKNTSLADGTVGKSYSETLKAELTGAELPAAT